MGFKITLNIKHIKGYTFQVDIEPDAEALGIKLLIWELQKIPISVQRLVFEGRELDDNNKINDLNINDGETLFLVETKLNGIERQVPPMKVVRPQPIAMTGMGSQGEAEPEAMVVSVQSAGYAPLDIVSLSSSELKMKKVTRLAAWMRAYFWICFVLSLLSMLLFCVFSVIPAIINMIGIIATKRLSRCLLTLPTIMIFCIGFGGLIGMIMHGELSIIALLICLFHVLIFCALCKLFCRITKLNSAEYRQSRVRAKWCC